MFQSILVVRVQPGRGPEAMRAFLDRGVLSECAEVIPSFIEGELRASTDDPDRICVLARWRDAEGYRAWGTHPVRNAQLVDLGPLVVEIEMAEVFGPVFEG